MEMLKNANISAGGILPMCQDTGTIIVTGKKGNRVWTEGDDESAISRGTMNAFLSTNLRYSQQAPLDMSRSRTPGPICPPRSRSTRTGATSTSSCS